ncbi:pilus assembly protein [Georgenia yuyongxinii]|uniref:Pilus assembly protein n=1 Tax=Georgenia yuyongxinii TaxID=2589797 RepID=A0A5B8C0L4_9MICO|nr:pilus assembly protein [Georgenia yuyongxinii]
MRSVGRNERGSAVVEFLGVSLLLLVPIVYLVLTLSRVQAATFAAEGAAREVGRIVAQAETLEAGLARAERAVELAFADQGFDVDGGQALRVSCAAVPCLTPGAEVHVEVATVVALPLVPDFLRQAVPAEVPIAAGHLVMMPEFREVP